MDFILASASPRRKDLLRQIGLSFQSIPSHLEEDVAAASPGELVKRLAYGKARRISLEEMSLPVLGADTVVVLGGQILGKPRDPRHAVRMLHRLQGQSHRVFTGVALVHGHRGMAAVGLAVTRVWMRPLTLREIKGYVATGEPADKAGAYGIQGIGGSLIPKIEGCYFNVVGLPLSLTVRMLKAFGVKIF